MKNNAKKELNGIRINLTMEDEQQIKNLLSDLKFQKTSIETMITTIKTGKGRIYIETTYNELAEGLFDDVANCNKAKKDARDKYRSRKNTILKRQEKMKAKLIDFLDVKCDGREGKENQYKPFIVKIDFVLLKHLVNLNNKGFGESKIKFNELRKIYGLD